MSMPSENAVNFEAVKVSMSQNKDGVMLKLAVHPQDCPQSLHTDWVGTRYMVALVRLNDDDTVSKNEDAEKRNKAVSQAALLCRNPRFQTWLVHMNIADAISEESASAGLKDTLLIKSRRELATDDVARKKFLDLVAAFEVDVSGGRV